MHPSQVTLLVVFLVVNACLWVEYAAMRPTVGDFGAITNDGARVYMLVAAAVAYLCNIAFVGLVVASKGVSPAHVDTVTVSVAVYYVLQLAFLPLVRASLKGAIGKVWARGVLALCVLPLVAITIVALQTKHAALVALSFVPLLHATVNDAALYGGLF